MITHERDHLTGHLQVRHICIQVDAIQALDIQPQRAAVGEHQHGAAAGLLARVRGSHAMTELANYGVDVDEAEFWRQYCRDAYAGIIMSVAASQAAVRSPASW